MDRENWIAACAHRLQRHWRTVDPELLEEVAGDLWADETLREMAHSDPQRVESPFVFPGTGKSGHLGEPKTAWRTILRKAGLTDLRLHDLRRTFGSWQAGTGANLSVIGRSLNHKSLATTKVYDRLWLTPVKQSMETAVTAMLAAGARINESEKVGHNAGQSREAEG